MSKNCNRGSQDSQIFGCQIADSYHFKVKEMEPLLLIGESRLHAPVLIFVVESMLSARSACLHKWGQSKDTFMYSSISIPSSLTCSVSGASKQIEHGEKNKTNKKKKSNQPIKPPKQQTKPPNQTKISNKQTNKKLFLKGTSRRC